MISKPYAELSPTDARLVLVAGYDQDADDHRVEVCHGENYEHRVSLTSDDALALASAIIEAAKEVIRTENS